MSISTPTARRLASRCLFCQPLPVCTRPSHRSASDDASSKPSRPNPVLDEFLRKNPNATRAPQPQEAQRPVAGDIASSSIFEDERRTREQQARTTRASAHGATTTVPTTDGRDPSRQALVLDPDPNARERWERKKVIQMVRRGGRLSKGEFLQRTEREHVVRSHNMKTSVKKLGMVARQIAGKTLEEAIVQMRFSGKKIAIEVGKQLEAAGDEAVVVRGMGLGMVKPEPQTAEDEAANSDIVASPTEAALPISIQLPSGRRHTVTDRSKIYIAQAWVGRGPFGKLPDYRARGQVNIMRTPWTSLSVVLKEEATRVREYEEREAKKAKRKVWMPLPDRPVTAQRGWYAF